MNAPHCKFAPNHFCEFVLNFTSSPLIIQFFFFFLIPSITMKQFTYGSLGTHCLTQFGYSNHTKYDQNNFFTLINMNKDETFIVSLCFFHVQSSGLPCDQLIKHLQHLSVCQECFWVSGKFKDEARQLVLKIWCEQKNKIVSNPQY